MSMQVSHILIATWITLITAAAVQADTLYSWKDARGNTHYVNNIYDVPERYRAKVKTVNLGIPGKSDSTQQPAAQALIAVPATATSPPAAPSATLTADVPPKTFQPVPAPPLPQNLFTAPERPKGDNRPVGKSRRGSRSSSGVDE